MDSRLMADRHPILGRLHRVWLARAAGASMPLAETITDRLADLDDVVVVIRRPASMDALKIERSGKVVDLVYGAALAGTDVSRLTPGRDDADNEVAVVFESGRTLMMEDEVQLAGGSARLARLYLPFADDVGQVAGLLVGIARVS